MKIRKTKEYKYQPRFVYEKEKQKICPGKSNKNSSPPNVDLLRILTFNYLRRPHQIVKWPKLFQDKLQSFL